MSVLVFHEPKTRVHVFSLGGSGYFMWKNTKSSMKAWTRPGLAQDGAYGKSIQCTGSPDQSPIT